MIFTRVTFSLLLQVYLPFLFYGAWWQSTMPVGLRLMFTKRTCAFLISKYRTISIIRLVFLHSNSFKVCLSSHQCSALKQTRDKENHQWLLCTFTIMSDWPSYYQGAATATRSEHYWSQQQQQHHFNTPTYYQRCLKCFYGGRSEVTNGKLLEYHHHV